MNRFWIYKQCQVPAIGPMSIYIEANTGKKADEFALHETEEINCFNKNGPWCPAVCYNTDYKNEIETSRKMYSSGGRHADWYKSARTNDNYLAKVYFNNGSILRISLDITS